MITTTGISTTTSTSTSMNMSMSITVNTSTTTIIITGAVKLSTTKKGRKASACRRPFYTHYVPPPQLS